MEVLAGVLTGANFGWANRRERQLHEARPAGFGHFFMAIDPELFMPAAEFTSRVDQLIEEAKSGERAEGADEILVPGERGLRAASEACVKACGAQGINLRRTREVRQGCGASDRSGGAPHGRRAGHCRSSR